MNSQLGYVGAAALLAFTAGCSLAINPEIPGNIGNNTNTNTNTNNNDQVGDVLFGQLCVEDSDCMSGLCRAQQGFDRKRCTTECNPALACPDLRISQCGSSGVCDFTNPPPLQDELRLGLLYVGPVGDHGWTLTHDRARLAVMDYITKNVGGQADATSEFKAFVSGPDAGEKIDELVQAGSNVVVATSFDFLTGTLNRANTYPDVNFLGVSIFQDGPNLGSYFGRMYQIMYLMGIIAGSVTQNNRIGLVWPVAIPETVRHANAFMLGAQSVNANVEVYLEWVEAWFNPDVEIEKSNLLLSQADVDVLMGATDTIFPLQTAAAATTSDGRPVYVIGYDNLDSCDFAPSRCMTSAYWNWAPLLQPLLVDMIEGNWVPGQIWAQVRDTPELSSAYFSQINMDIVPAQVQFEVENELAQMTSDSEEARMYPYKAPILDVNGTTRLNAGERFTDEDLLEMCWLVQGIRHADGTPATVPSQCQGVR